jgi:hypothetical protein
VKYRVLPEFVPLFSRRLAMARPIVGSASDWLGALKDFHRQCDDGSIALYQLRAFLEHSDPFTTLPDINWPETYKALGLQDEYGAVKDLVIPERPDLWVMPVAKGVTSNKVVNGHKKLGVNFYLYAEDLDVAVPTHDRDANRDASYVVGFRRVIEADEENANKSANQLAQIGHKGITLPERLLLGAGFYVATGQHLDVVNWTLCTGSRSSGGDVPDVCWSPARRLVYVHWCAPDDSDDYLRSRSVQFPLPA